MALHPARSQAISRCLDEGHNPALVAAELGVASSTLRGWLRWALLERQLEVLREEREAQQLRQRQIEQELEQAAEQLELLRQLLDPAEHRADD